MKTAAVLPALGIGDAILMMIASHQLMLAGYKVTTFHNLLPELKNWFPGQLFEGRLAKEISVEELKRFDLVIAENDNSSHIKQLIHHLRDSLSVFYPTYAASKHGPLSALDQVFDPNLPMAENIGIAIARLLRSQTISKDNGITPPSSLQHQIHHKRIIIHPTSRAPSKNWTAAKFFTLARILKEKGYDPAFCVSLSERNNWKEVEEMGCQIPELSSLSDLASFIYESGCHIGNDSLLGHLASNLNIPTVIIADDEKRMRLWRPGWLLGQVVLPPQWIPNPRILRWKQNHWQKLVFVRQVLKAIPVKRI